MLNICFIINSVMKWLLTHGVDEFFVCRKNPPQQHQKEKKEYHKGYDGPDLDVINASKNIFIHGD
jgi:hypothetical protein